jgi:hypothetical protein
LGGNAGVPRDSEDIRPINRFEVDADRFAMSALPVTEPKQWVFYGLPLIDALLWELPEAYGGPVPEGPDLPSPTVPIKVQKGRHPPLVLRLYDLVATIRATYTSFDGLNWLIPKVTFKIELTPENNKETKTDPYQGLWGGPLG